MLQGDDLWIHTWTVVHDDRFFSSFRGTQQNTAAWFSKFSSGLALARDAATRTIGAGLGHDFGAFLAVEGHPPAAEILSRD